MDTRFGAHIGKGLANSGKAIQGPQAYNRMAPAERTLEKVQKVAAVVRKHPATVYRWIEAYERSRRISAFLRKGRSDRGKSRLSKKVDAIIDTSITPADVRPGGSEEVAASGNGIVTMGCDAQSDHTKRRGINAHVAYGTPTGL